MRFIQDIPKLNGPITLTLYHSFPAVWLVVSIIHVIDYVLKHSFIIYSLNLIIVSPFPYNLSIHQIVLLV